MLSLGYNDVTWRAKCFLGGAIWALVFFPVPVCGCWTGLSTKATRVWSLSAWDSVPTRSSSKTSFCRSAWSRSDIWPSRFFEPSAVSQVCWNKLEYQNFWQYSVFILKVQLIFFCLFPVLHRNKMTHTDLKPENILFVCSDYDMVYNDQMVKASP